MTNQHSNRGLIWQEARRKLENIAGGTHHALPVSSGFAALVLAARLFNPPAVEVDEFTFYAAKQAVYAAGSEPIGGEEVDESYMGIPLLQTKWWGYNREFRKTKRPLIIDAAGGFGKDFLHDMPRNAVVCVSFHATKNFPIGEGGAIFIPKQDDEMVFDEVDAFHRFGVQFGTPGEIPERAFNFKMDELHASILLAQLENWKHFRARSRQIARCAHTIEISAGHENVVEYLKPGNFASLPVASLKRSAELIESLRGAGFEVKRTYDTGNMEKSLLTDWQRECVAFPADMTFEEENEMNDKISEFYKVAE